jgi:hypothetical protein
MGGEVQLGPLGTSATNWPIISAPGEYEDREFGGMMIGRGNRSTLYQLQIPHDLTWRTRAIAVGSQGLTALVTARPLYYCLSINAWVPPSFFFLDGLGIKFCTGFSLLTSCCMFHICYSSLHVHINKIN